MDFTADDKLFHLTFDSIYDGVYIVDRERKIVFWNKGAEKLTGYTADEVRGHRCSEGILNHIDANGTLLCRNACPIVEVMTTGIENGYKVYPKHKNGKRFPVETHISPVRDAEGNIVGAIEVFRDASVHEDYRILQEKFNALIKKYVSEQTMTEVIMRLHSEHTSFDPHLVDVTVMYLDIVQFTRFSEHHNPGQVIQMLNDLFGICEVITKESLGDIDKFIGDAIMAVFADANDAINSALKIISYGLPEMNRLRRENNEQEIHIRIGINSGIVLKGDIGTSDRKDLTIIGDPVNTASRIEKLAPHDHILVSEATLSRCSDVTASNFDFFHELEIRGKSQPIKLFVNKE
jgi:PAS domain S-box-containing protein